MSRIKKLGKYERWSLYWVAYNGEEDCFVVARNRRSACAYDAAYCGYQTGAAIAILAASISSNLAKRFFARKREAPSDALEARSVAVGPRYADDQIIRQLGGAQRKRDGIIETRFDDWVFTTGSDQIIYPRRIGKSFVENLRNFSLFNQVGEEDSYSENEQVLMTLLGICVARCQEIEELISQSFVLGVSHPGKDSHETINDMSRSWRKKTLGEMFRAIDHSYIVEPELRSALDAFLKMRNTLVHNLTTNEQYHIGSVWGRDEILSFLTWFEFSSKTIRRIFRGSYFASINFGNEYLLSAEDEKVSLSREEHREIQVFLHFFYPKHVAR